uniref:Reverse transcriptase domain-containing protein n=1 Tax=Strongyloides papillosus TaxID=174720 RepID=A0A0N5BDU1_STREA
MVNKVNAKVTLMEEHAEILKFLAENSKKHGKYDWVTVLNKFNKLNLMTTVDNSIETRRRIRHIAGKVSEVDPSKFLWVEEALNRKEVIQSQNESSNSSNVSSYIDTQDTNCDENSDDKRVPKDNQLPHDDKVIREYWLERFNILLKQKKLPKRIYYCKPYQWQWNLVNSILESFIVNLDLTEAKKFIFVAGVLLNEMTMGKKFRKGKYSDKLKKKISENKSLLEKVTNNFDDPSLQTKLRKKFPKRKNFCKNDWTSFLSILINKQTSSLTYWLNKEKLSRIRTAFDAKPSLKSIQMLLNKNNRKNDLNMNEATNFYKNLYKEVEFDLENAKAKSKDFIEMYCSQVNGRELVPAFSISDIIARLSNWKSPGPDKIFGILYKKLPCAFDKLQSYIEKCIESSSIPSSDTKAIIYLLHKSGDSNSVTNYRPISCCNTSYKAVTAYLNEFIIAATAETVMNPNEQLANARNVWGTCVAHYRDSSLVLDKKFTANKAKNTLVSAYVDFSKAFDSLHQPFIKYLNKHIIDSDSLLYCSDLTI